MTMGRSTTSPMTLQRIWQRAQGARVPALATWLLLAIAVIINAMIQPNFFTTYSITSNFATFVPLVTVAVAQTIVILGGGLDLSLGSIVALASVVAVKVMAGNDNNVLLGFAVALAVGATCGLINGAVIAYVRLQPVITTFATASIFAGVTLVVLPKPGGTVPGAMTGAYRAVIAGIPVTVLAVLVLVGIWLLLKRTRLVRHIYAVGGDASSAYASLVPVPRVRALTYVLSGTFAGLAAMALLANSGSGDPSVGGDFALNSVAAAVIGGVALKGGRGGGIGAIAGAIVISIVSSILFFLNVPTTFRQLASGLVIIAALALSAASGGRGARK